MGSRGGARCFRQRNIEYGSTYIFTNRKVWVQLDYRGA